MKQLLVYISPTDKFDAEHETLTKIQVDNSLELGWKPEDIILATNFPWEYRGVKSHVMEGDYGALDGNRSSKIKVIHKLLMDWFVNDVVWFHDHDAFQLELFNAPYADFSVTDHGWSHTWNAGSFFFNQDTQWVFEQILKKMGNEMNEQDALTTIYDDVFPNFINITHNLNIYQLKQNIEKADKPLLVAHFHPHKPRHMNLFRPILPQRLLDIFKGYGIE